MTNKQPVQVGDIHLVTAIRLNDDGDGVAAIAGFTTFVEKLLPGETARIAITRVERRFARGAILERQTSAAERTAPVCGVYDACGGCRLQHIGYPQQLDHKRDVVIQALTRIGGLQGVSVLPTLGMEAPLRYRNQVQVPIGYDAQEGAAKLGFFASGTHALVETDECQLEPLELEYTLREVARIATTVLGTAMSRIHHLIGRRSFTTGQQMVIFSIQTEIPGLEQVALSVSELPHVVSVGYTVQPRSHGPVWGKTVTVLVGADHLNEHVGDLDFLVSPRSFFQVNTEQTQVLYAKALEYAGVTDQDRVLDAYCGTGTMSLMLAQKAKTVVGIESIAAAVSDAKRNAKHNGIDNVRFRVGEVEKLLPQLVAKGQGFDVVVVDPPRKGCHVDVLDALVDAKPRRIVYVSCNPATLARDLRHLVNAGYSVDAVQPVDMFPQTSHVETVVLLDLKL